MAEIEVNNYETETEQTLNTLGEGQNQNVIGEVENNNLQITDQNSSEAAKPVVMADSDSEEDVNSLIQTNGNVTGCVETQNEQRLKSLPFVDSDSEEGTFNTNTFDDTLNANEKVESHNTSKRKFARKRLAIDDDDSDVERNDLVTNSKSFCDDKLNANEQPVFTTNSEGELIPEKVKTYQASRLLSLCDPETSEEEEDNVKNEDDNNQNYQEQKEIIIPKAYKKKQLKKNVAKPKKMTEKEAKKQRTEIKSESQRMLREKNISLPYHIPKSYTLKEFLSRRPKFSSSVQINMKTPPSVAIKMSTEQLTLVSKKLKEREKEVKEFYKSESESEEDHDDKDCVPPFEIDAKKDPDRTEPSVDITDVLVTRSDKKDDENGQPLILSGDPTISNLLEQDEDLELNRAESNAASANFEDCIDQGNVLLVDDTEEQKDYDGMAEHGINPVLNINEDQSKDCLQHTTYSDNEDLEKGKESMTSSETLKINGANEKCSMDYEFNLEDLEENSENPIEKENTKDKTSGFEYSDLDKEIENFGSTDEGQLTDSTVQSKNVSKLELIKECITNTRPKLTGGPDDVIDLESGLAKPNEITKLMERFVEHNNYKKLTHKNKVQLSVVSVESGEIHKETVAMKLDDENEAMVVEEKPGAKLQKLRDELQVQMAQRRSELWQKKATKESRNEEKDTYEGEKEDCGLEDDILDDEEEMEMSESSEEEDDECNQEDKEKSVFIEEEAEVSDEDEGLAEIEVASEDEDANEGDDENEIDDSSEKDSNEDEVDQAQFKRTFKKIRKGFTEDSDDEECDDAGCDLTIKSHEIKTNHENTNTLTQDDDVFPPNQPQNSQTPIRHITQKKSDFEFLTPISYITGLQNLNSTSKNLNDSPVMSTFENANEPSPLKENNWERSLQRKLFMDAELTASQVAEVCSGEFPETQESASVDKDRMAKTFVDEFPCTSNTNENERLAELCSGKFPSTAEVKRLSDEAPTTQDLLNICSGEFTGITQCESVEKPESINEKAVESYLLNSNKEVKSLDADQDLIISQLIDEEEMEKFKKKFESPFISKTQRRIVEEFEEAVASGGVIDSDDDGETVEVKKKNQRRLKFSDDEDSEDDDNEEEIIDLHDNIEEDEGDTAALDNVNYDSEENEIEHVYDGASKPSDFFENEAQLSESEWGSADEDERDLDTMEFEQGDTEKFDDKKMRSDLEKIHMRRLLDDDTKQVKMLQEILLEDGELHGTGRERQFRWKNIDSVVETDDDKKEEDDVYLDEEESEEQWRKRRYEREMFLKEKQSKSQDLDDDTLLQESQLLKIGHKVIQRSQSNSQNNTPVDKSAATSESPVLKQPFALLNKRGSFLSRGDQVLQKLAEYNKVTSVVIGGAKNSRNFVFQTVTTEKIVSLNNKDKKRKAADGTPNAIKRLRLSNNLSPAVKKKPSAKAKLFGNW